MANPPISAPPIADGPANVPSLRTLGTGATQAAAGNDPRFSSSVTLPAAYANGSAGPQTIALDLTRLGIKITEPGSGLNDGYFSIYDKDAKEMFFVGRSGGTDQVIDLSANGPNASVNISSDREINIGVNNNNPGALLAITANTTGINFSEIDLQAQGGKGYMYIDANNAFLWTSASHSPTATIEWGQSNTVTNFHGSITGPTPTLSTQYATKGYVDANSAGTFQQTYNKGGGGQQLVNFDTTRLGLTLQETSGTPLPTSSVLFSLKDSAGNSLIKVDRISSVIGIGLAAPNNGFINIGATNGESFNTPTISIFAKSSIMGAGEAFLDLEASASNGNDAEIDIVSNGGAGWLYVDAKTPFLFTDSQSSNATIEWGRNDTTTNVHGAFNVATGGGIINLHSNGGAIDVNTGTASFDVSTGGGGIDIETSGGGLIFGTSNGGMEFNVGASGDIDITAFQVRVVGDVIPLTDNTGNVGLDAKRWQRGRFVTVVTGSSLVFSDDIRPEAANAHVEFKDSTGVNTSFTVFTDIMNDYSAEVGVNGLRIAGTGIALGDGSSLSFEDPSTPNTDGHEFDYLAQAGSNSDGSAAGGRGGDIYVRTPQGGQGSGSFDPGRSGSIWLITGDGQAGGTGNGATGGWTAEIGLPSGTGSMGGARLFTQNPTNIEIGKNDAASSLALRGPLFLSGSGFDIVSAGDTLHPSGNGTQDIGTLSNRWGHIFGLGATLDGESAAATLNLGIGGSSNTYLKASGGGNDILQLIGGGGAGFMQVGSGNLEFFTNGNGSLTNPSGLVMRLTNARNAIIGGNFANDHHQLAVGTVSDTNSVYTIASQAMILEGGSSAPTIRTLLGGSSNTYLQADAGGGSVMNHLIGSAGGAIASTGLIDFYTNSSTSLTNPTNRRISITAAGTTQIAGGFTNDHHLLVVGNVSSVDPTYTIASEAAIFEGGNAVPTMSSFIGGSSNTYLQGKDGGSGTLMNHLVGASGCALASTQALDFYTLSSASLTNPTNLRMTIGTSGNVLIGGFANDHHRLVVGTVTDTDPTYTIASEAMVLEGGSAIPTVKATIGGSSNTYLQGHDTSSTLINLLIGGGGAGFACNQAIDFYTNSSTSLTNPTNLRMRIDANGTIHLGDASGQTSPIIFGPNNELARFTRDYNADDWTDTDILLFSAAPTDFTQGFGIGVSPRTGGAGIPLSFAAGEGDTTQGGTLYSYGGAGNGVRGGDNRHYGGDALSGDNDGGDFQADGGNKHGTGIPGKVLVGTMVSTSEVKISSTGTKNTIYAPTTRPVGTALTSAATISPTEAIHHVTGTANVSTINVPYTGFTGKISFIPDGAFTWDTAGNIALAGTAVVNRLLEFVYDGTSWYPSYV